MSRQPSSISTALLLLLASIHPQPATASVGLPIRLEEPQSVLFSGAFLVVTDLDCASGSDLAGITGTSVVFALNDGHGDFGALQSSGMGTGALVAFGVADLDGDGYPDLVATSSDARTFAVRRGQPGGGFQAPELTVIPGIPRTLGLGDLNSDGRPDAVARLDSGFVAILWNDGTGHLGAATRVEIADASGEPQIADFNGDGRGDLLVTANSATPQVMFLAGRGDGTFDQPLVTTAPAVFDALLAADDLDGDADLDLVGFNGYELAVLPNRGNGTFASAVTLQRFNTISYSASRLAIGDVDRDGRPDIAFANLPNGDGMNGADSYLSVCFNRGGLSFGPLLNYRVGPAPSGVALADLDGDGWLDGIATGYTLGACCPVSSNPVRHAFLLHNRGGTLEGLLEVYEPVWLPARDAPHALPDLYGTLGGAMYRARNRGNGTFEPAERIGWGDPQLAIDLDADGDDDLLVTGGDSTWVLPNLGGAGFGPPSMTLVGSTIRDFADFDGNGTLDLFVTDPISEVVVYPGDGAGGFGPPIDYGRTLPPDLRDAVRGADVNQDGRADVMYLLGTDEYVGGNPRFVHTVKLFTLLNDRSDGFAPPESSGVVLGSQFPVSAGPGMARLGDWNGDGLKDVAHLTNACTFSNGALLEVFFGNGDGSFRAVQSPPSGGDSPCDLQSGDLNRDGLDDLVRINSNVGGTFAAIILASDGGEGFSEGIYPMGEMPVELRLADVDGDGRLDVVTRNRKPGSYSNPNSYSIRRNVTPDALPTAALVSLVSSRVEDGVVHLDWFSAGSSVFSATIERRSLDSGWNALGRRTSDGTGHLRFDDRDVVGGKRYAYRVRTSDAAEERVSAEAWVRVPGAAFALDGAWPNPSDAHPTIAFSLPYAGSVELTVLDITGRRVRRERREGLAAGPQRFVFEGAGLAPGLYVARLAFSGRTLGTRFVVLP